MPSVPLGGAPLSYLPPAVSGKPFCQLQSSFHQAYGSVSSLVVSKHLSLSGSRDTSTVRSYPSPGLPTLFFGNPCTSSITLTVLHPGSPAAPAITFELVTMGLGAKAKKETTGGTRDGSKLGW